MREVQHCSANPGIRTANPSRMLANPKSEFLRISNPANPGFAGFTFLRILRILDSTDSQHYESIESRIRRICKSKDLQIQIHTKCESREYGFPWICRILRSVNPLCSGFELYEAGLTFMRFYMANPEATYVFLTSLETIYSSKMKSTSIVF